jgi:hypothetical protein
MAITKTTVNIRPNTTVDFYSVAGRAAFAAGNTSVLLQFQTMHPKLKAMIDAGKYHLDETVSDDGLTQTRVVTLSDLAAFNEAETAYDIAQAKEFQDYRIANTFSLGSYTTPEQRAAAIAYSGIDAPFTLTTTYTFTSPTEPYIDTFVAALENYNHYNKLTDLVIDGANVIVTHQYLNSADQTANQYLDMFFIPQLAEKGVTRTIHYAMV